MVVTTIVCTYATKHLPQQGELNLTNTSAIDWDRILVDAPLTIIEYHYYWLPDGRESTEAHAQEGPFSGTISVILNDPRV
jgi:hypothetical protein